MKNPPEQLNWDMIDDHVMDFYMKQARIERAKAVAGAFRFLKALVTCAFKWILSLGGNYQPCRF